MGLDTSMDMDEVIDTDVDININTEIDVVVRIQKISNYIVTTISGFSSFQVYGVSVRVIGYAFYTFRDILCLLSTGTTSFDLFRFPIFTPARLSIKTLLR